MFLLSFFLKVEKQITGKPDAGQATGFLLIPPLVVWSITFGAILEQVNFWPVDLQTGTIGSLLRPNVQPDRA